MMKKSLGAKTMYYRNPVFIDGTYDKDGRANAMKRGMGRTLLFQTTLCCNFSPGRPRHTYGNIAGAKGIHNKHPF